MATDKLVAPADIPYNDPNVRYVDGNPYKDLKSQDKHAVRTVLNPLNIDMVVRWDGKDNVIKSGKSFTGVEYLVLHIATHIARKIGYTIYNAQYMPHEQAPSFPQEREIELMKAIVDKTEIDLPEVLDELARIQKEISSFAQEEIKLLVTKSRQNVKVAEARKEAIDEKLQAKRVNRGEIEAPAPEGPVATTDATDDIVDGDAGEPADNVQA